MNKLFILIFTVLATVHATADDVGRGGYAGSYLRMGLGSAGMAMGGGSVALVRDGCTSYYNPAGLVFLEKRWATASLHSMALDRKLFHVGYAQSIKAKRGTRGKTQPFIRGGFSLGWICAGVDKIDGRDFDGRHTDMLSSWENAFFFSFAMNPAPPIAFGFNGKLLYSRFAKVRNDGKAMTTAGFGFDIGIMV
ncbi:MAG TPA: hypothetical protein VGB38_04070, partial [bacterium]